MQNQHEPTAAHNHIEKLIELLQVRALELQPGLQFFTVLHDDWCDIFAGGFCNCDPEVIMRTPAAECLELGSSKARDNFMKLIRKGA